MAASDPVPSCVHGRNGGWHRGRRCRRGGWSRARGDFDGVCSGRCSRGCPRGNHRIASGRRRAHGPCLAGVSDGPPGSLGGRLTDGSCCQPHQGLAPMRSTGLLRMIGRQVRSRRDRSIALGAGILVASVSFSLLTAAAATSQLEVHGTVDAASRPAYDILVRPKGAADAIETQDNLVRDNFLAGTYGGISIAQWQKILDLPNVTVAAPIANIGYVIPQATVVIPVEPVSSSDPHQLYRVNITWKADSGLSAYPGGTDYVYYTPSDRFVRVPTLDGGYFAEEVVPGQRKPINMCPNIYP